MLPSSASDRGLPVIYSLPEQDSFFCLLKGSRFTLYWVNGTDINFIPTYWRNIARAIFSVQIWGLLKYTMSRCLETEIYRYMSLITVH